MGLTNKTLFLTLTVLVTAAAASGIERNKSQTKSAPVEVASFQIEDLGHELRIIDVALKSGFVRPVKAVEFTWYVMEGEGVSAVIVKEGLPTAWIALPAQLKEGEELKLNSAGIRIRKILLKDVDLSGGRRIEVKVTNVLYADGSSWRQRLRARRL